MFRTTLLRLRGGLVLLAAFWACAAQAQSPTRGEAARAKSGGEGKVRRVIYDVKLGVAKDLADTLSKVFKADANVQIVVAPTGNALVIGAPAKTAEEILQLLRELDRRPRTVAVEVLVAEVAPRQGKDGKPAAAAPALNEAQFNGRPEVVFAKLQDLQKKGLLSTVERLRLKTTENHSGSVTNGASRPYTTGIVRSSRGTGMRSVMYRAVGTKVKATPHIGEDQRILLDLNVSVAGMRVRADGPVMGKDDDGKPVRATELVNAQFDGSVVLRPGQATVVKGVTTKSQSEQVQMLVIVSAQLAEPEAKAGR